MANECPKCGEHFITHNDDGSCVAEVKKMTCMGACSAFNPKEYDELCAKDLKCRECCDNECGCGFEKLATYKEWDDRTSNMAEAQAQRDIEDFYGGDGPQTLSEEMEVLERDRWKVK